MESKRREDGEKERKRCIREKSLRKMEGERTKSTGEGLKRSGCGIPNQDKY